MRRRRLLPLGVGILVASVGTVGVAVATGVLGGPAPDPVKAHLAELDVLRDDDLLGTAHDATEPLVLTTNSDSQDLSQVLGIEGRVNLTGTIRLEVRFPDGARLAVPLAADRSYSLVFRSDRRDDFATTPGVLVVLRDGAVVASQPIESVALGRARNG